jgi:hypothetical protein
VKRGEGLGSEIREGDELWIIAAVSGGSDHSRW